MSEIINSHSRPEDDFNPQLTLEQALDAFEALTPDSEDNTRRKVIEDLLNRPAIVVRSDGSVDETGWSVADISFGKKGDEHLLQVSKYNKTPDGRDEMLYKDNVPLAMFREWQKTPTVDELNAMLAVEPPLIQIRRPDKRKPTGQEPDDPATSTRVDGTPLIQRPGVEFGNQDEADRTLVTKTIGRMAAGFTSEKTRAKDEAIEYFKGLRAVKDTRWKEQRPVENGYEFRRLERKERRKKFMGKIAAGIANTFRPEDNTPIVESPDSRAHYRVDEKDPYFQEYRDLAAARNKHNEEVRAKAEEAKQATLNRKEAKRREKAAKHAARRLKERK